MRPFDLLSSALEITMFVAAAVVLVVGVVAVR
jgi:hypothetical protein